jgi:hypothetical protein
MGTQLKSNVMERILFLGDPWFIICSDIFYLWDEPEKDSERNNSKEKRKSN